MSMVSEKEIKKEKEFLNVNPWDMIIWKLNSVEKQVEKVDQKIDKKLDSIEKQIEKVDQKVDKLEEKVDQKINKLEEKVDRVNQRVDGVNQRIDKVLQGNTMLQWTAVIGFIATIVAIFTAPLLR